MKTPYPQLTNQCIEYILNHQETIFSWLASLENKKELPLYSSVDIRDAGFKACVVDTNLFPAGFNNLCRSFSKETADAFRSHLNRHHPGRVKILLLAEEQTRNKYYLKNIFHLKKLLGEAGREVHVGITGDLFSGDIFEVALDDGILLLEKIARKGNQISCGSYVPDLVISNNDFATGVPEILKGITQPVIPSPHLGWVQRRKQHHFGILHDLIIEFGKTFGIDPWLLSAETAVVSDVTVGDAVSMSRIASEVESLLGKTRQKYAEHGISEAPYVYVKSARGTYGMGLITVFSGDEILNLNRRKMNKLSSTKGGAVTTDYLIQEGVPTVDFYSGYPIEPVIYVVGRRDVGGFFRIHPEKSGLESLNAPGMDFYCLCLHKLDEPHESYFLDCTQKEQVVSLSRFLARLDALAVAIESR